MATTTVFIASKTEQENYLLQKKLEPLQKEFIDLKLAGLHIAGLANAADHMTAAIIMNLSEWTPKEACDLKRSSARGFQITGADLSQIGLVSFD